MSALRSSCWLLIAALVCNAGCARIVQIGTDEEAFSEVDALYTAVTTRRTDLLSDSKARLASLRDDGRLPEAALAQLQPVIAQAEKGEWKVGAENLYIFIRHQRKGR